MKLGLGIGRGPPGGALIVELAKEARRLATTIWAPEIYGRLLHR